MSGNKKKAPKAPTTLFDVNTCAPDYWSVTPSSEWSLRVHAFVEAMATLDRAVLVHYDPDSGKLYLSSIPAAVSR